MVVPEFGRRNCDLFIWGVCTTGQNQFSIAYPCIGSGVSSAGDVGQSVPLEGGVLLVSRGYRCQCGGENNGRQDFEGKDFLSLKVRGFI